MWANDMGDDSIDTVILEIDMGYFVTLPPAPDPVAEGEVHEVNPAEDVDEVGAEQHAVGEGARHQRRRDHGEHTLVAAAQGPGPE
jgi:hypothetical protein